MAAVTTFACEQCGRSLAFDGVRTADAARTARARASSSGPYPPASPIRVSSSHSRATRPGRAARSSAGSAAGTGSPIPRCARRASRICGGCTSRHTCTAPSHTRTTRRRSPSTTRAGDPQARRRNTNRDADRDAYRVPASRRAPRRRTSPTWWSARRPGSRHGELAGIRAVRLPADAALQPGAGLGVDRGGICPAARRVPRREPPRGARRGRDAAAPVHARRRATRTSTGARTSRGSRSIRCSCRCGCLRCATAATARRCAS